ncbi:hypothetical protein [Chelatococcus sp.]|uniref:hypothetical protein n=1 Tax=Chelatococcus sp. TaxID=1953771 RepID=UPI001ED02A43|nr:hypothetical protein [Chelatococcus sp.]MBX3543565.1 hypothetical protein [Chelatococcus sp.]
MARRPHHPTNPGLSPEGEAYLSMGQLQNLVNSAAERAALAVARQVLTREETERLARDVAKDIAEDIATSAASKSLEQFMLRIGIEEKDLANVRKDFSWMRSAREISGTMARHGMLSGIGLLVVALGTALWVGITRGMIK